MSNSTLVIRRSCEDGDIVDGGVFHEGGMKTSIEAQSGISKE